MAGCAFYLLLVVLRVSVTLAVPYYGALIGDISTIHHGVTGTVYAASATRLVIRGFSYDGTAPDAFFWIGSSGGPSPSGTILPVDPNNPDEKLGRFADAEVVLDLPSGTTVSDYRWLSVWCRAFTANFGHVDISADFVAPAVKDLGALPTYAHQVRADSVKVLDVKTFRFENLHYDGNGPDVYFWAGTTSSPTRDGIKLIWKPGRAASGDNQRVDRAFTGETILVTMPEGMTVRDIRYIGLWCVIFRSNFGHVSFNPSELNVPADIQDAAFDHCEVLLDNEFQVSWKIEGSNIKVEHAGRVTPGNYLAFGLSGSDSGTLMDGSDVVVTWMDIGAMGPRAVDYRLQSKAQCTINNGNGACPDDIASIGGTNDAAIGQLQSNNGITRISYTKPLDTDDDTDQVIPIDRAVFISWAIGPINPDGRVAKHIKAPLDDVSIHFGRQGSTSCPEFTADTGGGTPLEPWAPSSIDGETTFRVEIGQSGDERGYTGITGKVGWGIAWYVNELLIPEITVERGTTYTFQVYGGDDPTRPAQYHPFYITDDAEGGYDQKTEAEKMGVDIYAGPTEGPYCEWQVATPGTSPDSFNNFADYKSNLELNCNEPNPTPGILTWTPDGSTPDLVYYQCYTHRFLGWRIRVVDGPEVTMGTMPRAPTTSQRPVTSDMDAASVSGTSAALEETTRLDMQTTTTAPASVSGTSAGQEETTRPDMQPTTPSGDLGASPSPTASATASVTVSVIFMIATLLAVLFI